MTSQSRRSVHNAVVVAFALAALVLLVSFYSVVNNAVEASSARRAEAMARPLASSRQAAAVGRARLVLVGSSATAD